MRSVNSLDNTANTANSLVIQQAEPYILALGYKDCLICGSQHYGDVRCIQLCKACGERFRLGQELRAVVGGLAPGLLSLNFVHMACAAKGLSLVMEGNIGIDTESDGDE